MAVKVEWYGDDFTRKLDKEQRAALSRVAVHFQGQVKRIFSKYGTGKYGPPSPPGKPPGVRTGTLRRSIQIDRSKNKGPKPMIRVGTNLVYAPAHEFGSKVGNLPMRPFMRPAFDRSKRKMVKIYQDSIAKFIRTLS